MTSETSPDSIRLSSSNSSGWLPLNSETIPTTDSVLCLIPELDTTSPNPGPPFCRRIAVHPDLMSYVIIPPRADAAVSAPDAFGNAVLSASAATRMTVPASCPRCCPRTLRAAAAPATQHAEDEPRPAPGGISDFTSSVIPPLRPAILQASFAMWYRGLRTGSTSAASRLNDSHSSVPSSEVIRTLSDFAAPTCTRLSIAHSMALEPYTTKCSPNSMTLPGADATIRPPMPPALAPFCMPISCRVFLCYY